MSLFALARRHFFTKRNLFASAIQASLSSFGDATFIASQRLFKSLRGTSRLEGGCGCPQSSEGNLRRKIYYRARSPYRFGITVLRTVRRMEWTCLIAIAMRKLEPQKSAANLARDISHISWCQRYSARETSPS